MKKVLYTFFLFTFCTIHPFGKKTLVGIRSESVNSVREVCGWQRHINLFDCDGDWYTTLAGVVEYNRSFKADEIANFLLGGECMTFSGHAVEDRKPTDILADYFGLPPDFKSIVRFHPTITDLVFDLDWYLGFDCICPGFYVRVHAPIVHSKWDLKFLECIADAGATGTSYPAGYLAATDLERSELPGSVEDVFEGVITFGDLKQPLKFGKIFGREVTTRLSDLQLIVGWNFLLDDWYHFGLNGRLSFPTGTRRNAEFLFEPVVGNGHHWELGIGLTSHVQLWYDEECDRSLGLYVDANISHLFPTSQVRSYDLLNGPGSRYILLQQFASPSQNLSVGIPPENVLPSQQYQGRLVNAINVTSLESKIRINMQADIVAKISYFSDSWEFDFGYNVWAISKEKLLCRQSIPKNCFALKGDAQIYGFSMIDEQAVPLSVTQSKATINAGQAQGNFVSGVEYTNMNADNPAPAADGFGLGLNQLTAGDAVTFAIVQQQIFSSLPSILLTDADIDNESALLPKGISHKLFIYSGYTWEDDCFVVQPYLGGGVFVELAHIDVCNNSAFSRWGIWAKLGLSY